MAETAAILNPDRTVLHPEPRAVARAMALRLGPNDVLAALADHPDAAVVAVNSSAAVKAVADVCCTLANAVQVVNALAEDEVIFVPDRNLAAHVAARTEKTVFPVPATGCCPVHQALDRGRGPGSPGRVPRRRGDGPPRDHARRPGRGRLHRRRPRP